MAEIVTQSVSNPEFPRVVQVSDLRDLDTFDFEISPKDAEFAALAELLGARSIRKMRFSGKLEREGSRDWRLTARLGATVVQNCVVTLEPVTTRIDQDVHRRFTADVEPSGKEIILSLTDDEDDAEVEVLGRSIDLGTVAIEALALALPDYPRKSDAKLETGVTGASEVNEPEKPFAALSALRDRLEGGE